MHVGCALVSASSFVRRAALMVRASPLLEVRMARVAPHVVDTLLPATALATPVAARLDPPAMPRLAAKLVALVGYIVPGATALRHGRTRAMRILALAGTPPALAFIFAAPITRSPLAPFG